MPTVQLDDRALVLVTDDDAETLLQNIITTDISSLKTGEVKPGALLAPQGKILFDFLVSRVDTGFRLDCRADVADDLVKRLTLYRLRAKAKINKQDQALVAVSWGDDSRSSPSDSASSRNESSLLDTRFPEVDVSRHYGKTAGGSDRAEWDALRAAHGIAESGADYELGDAFPHDVLLDQTGGVGLAKGCYVGQEVVSRMQHRGTARRRVLIATGPAALPAPGTEILANGRPLGALGTVAGRTGLAIVRIDRVKDAMAAGNPITADGLELELAIPSWAKFTFPADAASAEGA
ncbi:CAF17-like 4Fe-4S cluster assembly/insertion protein YgfZ [Mesorhizobium sp. L-8-3]|uniref:CAF17-like 4Fe-4S cluster assembly/insertion protein YgfZ n=1 Tax=Mesorhizobium sp. L-8-3 TaxID=2744522 RepID=UPI00192734CC|nr:folate-binding protein YgfZ [Mesorhizobium sp. L-8-3]BCH25872.1 aminomethyltransferase [Mesorhizobium sp. L-8-3]